MLVIAKVKQNSWKAKLIQWFSGSEINHVMFLHCTGKWAGLDPKIHYTEDFPDNGMELVRTDRYEDFTQVDCVEFIDMSDKFKYSQVHNFKVFLANLPVIGRFFKWAMLKWWKPDKYKTNCVGFICTIHNMPDEYYFRLPKDL